MLYKLAMFHYTRLFTFQVIQYNVFHVSYLSIWWRHDIWILEKLKLYYLKNEKSFWSEIKNIFPCFTSAFFRHTKQTSKNVANTTFKSSVGEILVSCYFFIIISSLKGRSRLIYIRCFKRFGTICTIQKM